MEIIQIVEENGNESPLEEKELEIIKDNKTGKLIVKDKKRNKSYYSKKRKYNINNVIDFIQKHKFRLRNDFDIYLILYFYKNHFLI